jgi:hypothetical protein
LAIKIIAHKPGDPTRAAAIHEAARRPELFTELDKRYDDGRTTDQAIRSYLLTKGFIPPAADATIRSYRETKGLVEAEPQGHNPDASVQADNVKEVHVEVGDLIQVEIAGAYTLPKAARVRAIREHEGLQWVFIEGSETGIPMEQVVVEQRGKDDLPRAAHAPPRLPETKASETRLVEQPGLRREVFALDEGDLVISYPEDLSLASYEYELDGTPPDERY